MYVIFLKNGLIFNWFLFEIRLKLPQILLNMLESQLNSSNKTTKLWKAPSGIKSLLQPSLLFNLIFLILLLLFPFLEMILLPCLHLFTLMDISFTIFLRTWLNNSKIFLFCLHLHGEDKVFKYLLWVWFSFCIICFSKYHIKPHHDNLPENLQQQLAMLPPVLEVQLLTGEHAGKMTFIPRLSITPSSSQVPFEFCRQQFPVKVCFAMSINKSQGQSVD